MGEVLGERVGYALRFENMSREGVTAIKFVTDGVLLREMLADPLLSRYSVSRGVLSLASNFTLKTRLFFAAALTY